MMKGLASFNIPISELILKYIFSVKMSVHLFTKEKVLNLQVEIVSVLLFSP